jgi:uroporphyrinogen-III decarboxylase
MGVIPIFHLDSNWDRGLEYFRELPTKKCIMSLDSTTDIRKAKEIVGDMMCIMGDVPAYMTAFGTYEEVYEHTMKLIDDIGPTGYIVSSGCDIPANAKMETVQAIADAANNYLKIRNGI